MVCVSASVCVCVHAHNVCLCVCLCLHVSVCVSVYTMHLCGMCGVFGLTPQINEVRWNDEEDENVLQPVEEQATK